MTNALAKQDSTKLKVWRSLSNSKPIVKPNEIKFINSVSEDDFGKFYAIKYEDGEPTKEEIPLEEVNFLLLMSRVQIRSTDLDSENKVKYWCREIDNSAYEHIDIHDKEGNIVETGFYKNLKEKYKLKYFDTAYVYYKGEIYRWTISGAHFETWFPVKKEALKTPHKIKVSSIDIQKTGSVKYYALNFEVGEAYDLDEAIEIGKKLNQTLHAYYNSVAKQDAKAIEQIEGDTPDDLPF